MKPLAAKGVEVAAGRDPPPYLAYSGCGSMVASSLLERFHPPDSDLTSGSDKHNVGDELAQEIFLIEGSRAIKHAARTSVSSIPANMFSTCPQRPTEPNMEDSSCKRSPSRRNSCLGSFDSPNRCTPELSHGGIELTDGFSSSFFDSGSGLHSVRLTGSRAPPPTRDEEGIPVPSKHHIECENGQQDHRDSGDMWLWRWFTLYEKKIEGCHVSDRHFTSSEHVFMR